MLGVLILSVLFTPVFFDSLGLCARGGRFAQGVSGVLLRGIGFGG